MDNGGALALSGPYPAATLDEARERVLWWPRKLVLMALPQVNPLGGAGGLYAARQAVLAALPRVDWPLFETILNNLFPGAGNVIYAIGQIGDEAIRTATGVLQAAFGALYDLLGRIGDALHAALAGIVYVLVPLLAAVFRPLWETLTAVIRGSLGILGFLLGTAFHLAGGVIAAAFHAGSAVIGAAFGAVGTVLHGAVVWLGGRLLEVIGGLGNVLHNAVTWLGGHLGGVFSAIGTVLHGAVVWLGGILAGVAAGLGDVLVGLFRLLIAVGSTVIAVVIGFVKTYIVDPLAHIATSIVHMASDVLASLSDGNPEAVIGVAAGLALAVIPFGTAAHLLANAAEHTHPLKQVGYGLTARALVDLTSMQKISEASIGVGYALALGRPMEYWLSRRIRWRLPSEMDISIMYTKRDISEGDARLWLAYHGYNEHRIAALTEGFWREPPLFALRRLLDAGTVPFAWLRLKLRRNGYRDEDVDVISTALEHNQYSSQRGALYSAAFALLRHGFGTAADFAADVAPLALAPQQISLAVKAAELDYTAELVGLQVTALRTQAVNGIISVAELGQALAALGIRHERIRIEQSRARTAIAPRVAAKAKGAAEKELRALQTEQTSLYVQRFRRGIIDSSHLERSLLAVGLDPDLVALVVAIEVARRTPLVPVKADTSAEAELARLQVAQRRLYVDEFRAGLIDGPTLETDLIAAGDTPELAATIATDEAARAYRPPSGTPSPDEEKVARALLDQLASFYREQFRAGLIDRDAYLAGLIAAGMDPDVAEVTVEREQLRQAVAAAG